MKINLWRKRKNKNPEEERPKGKTRSDWLKDGIEKLEAFCKQGETFNYLGITMMVTGHWKLLPNQFSFDVHPSLQCDYADKDGVLRQTSFGLDMLETLKREAARK